MYKVKSFAATINTSNVRNVRPAIKVAAVIKIRTCLANKQKKEEQEHEKD